MKCDCCRVTGSRVHLHFEFQAGYIGVEMKVSLTIDEYAKISLALDCASASAL